MQIGKLAASDDLCFDSVDSSQKVPESVLIVAHRLYGGCNNDPQFLKLRVIGVLFRPIGRSQLLLLVEQLLVIFAIIIFGGADPIRVLRRQQPPVLHPKLFVRQSMRKRLCDDVSLLLPHSLPGGVELLPGMHIAVIHKKVIMPVRTADLGTLLEMCDDQNRKVREEGLRKFDPHLMTFIPCQKLTVRRRKALYIMLVLQICVVLIDTKFLCYVPTVITEGIDFDIDRSNVIGTTNKFTLFITTVFAVFILLIEQIFNSFVRLRMSYRDLTTALGYSFINCHAPVLECQLAILPTPFSDPSRQRCRSSAVHGSS